MYIPRYCFEMYALLLRCTCLSRLIIINNSDDSSHLVRDNRNSLCPIYFKDILNSTDLQIHSLYKGNNKITELGTILQRESQNS